MDVTILNEAFKELKMLDEEAFNLNSEEEMEDARDLLTDVEVDDVVPVIDMDAETETDVQTDLIGKVILECSVCHSKIFEDVDHVEIGDEGEAVNAGEECPYCFSVDGYKVIGQVAPIGQVEERVEDETEDGDLPEAEFDAEEIKLESLKKNRAKQLKEAYTGDLQSDVYNALADIVFNTGATEEEMDAAIEWFQIRFWEVEELGEAFKKGECENEAIAEAAEVCPKCGKTPCACEECLEEDFKDVSITTDDTHMEMTSDESGKVTVTTEPVQSASEEGGMLAPVDDSVRAEILDSEMPEEEEEVDVDMEEFDEDSFNELGESYLKIVYENVESFQTSSVQEASNQLIIEGVIKFNSGSSKKTSFLFEAKDIDRKGRIRFIGENKEITSGKKAFLVSGKMDGKKFMCESLNYNYRTQDTEGKSTRLHGVVRRKDK